MLKLVLKNAQVGSGKSHAITVGSHEAGDETYNTVDLKVRALLDAENTERLNAYYQGPGGELLLPMHPHLKGITPQRPDADANASWGTKESSVSVQGSMKELKIERQKNKGTFLSFTLGLVKKDADELAMWRLNNPDWSGTVRVSVKETLWDAPQANTGEDAQQTLDDAKGGKVVEINKKAAPKKAAKKTSKRAPKK